MRPMVEQLGPRTSPCRASALAVLLGASACGGAARPVGSTTVVAMEPVRVTATRSSAGEIEVDAYDARDLLRLGNEALEAGRIAEAIELYDRLGAEFPDSDLVVAAEYNAALGLERAGRGRDAAERYVRLATVHPSAAEVNDALFQAAGCFERLEAWTEAAAVLERILVRAELDPSEQLEALARRGAALVEAGVLDEGEAELRRAVALARRAGAEALRTDYHLAQAQFFLGEVPRRRMGAVRLEADEQRFRTGLEARCELLLRAQTQYVQAIRVGNAQWAAAAAYRIGEMYSSLFADVVAVPVPEAEVPPDMTDAAEIEAFRREYPRHYRRLLSEYLEPLLHNAIRWWETNLMMVERTGVEGDWVGRTRAELIRVRGLLDDIQAEVDTDTSSDPPDPAASPPVSPPPEAAPAPPTHGDRTAPRADCRMATFLLDTAKRNG